jgi:hypothetical protein
MLDQKKKVSNGDGGQVNLHQNADSGKSIDRAARNPDNDLR